MMSYCVARNMLDGKLANLERKEKYISIVFTRLGNSCCAPLSLEGHVSTGELVTAPWQLSPPVVSLAILNTFC